MAAKYNPYATRDQNKKLFHCCRTGNLQTLKHMVEKESVNIHVTDPWGNAPLYLACLCGHIKVVEYLLQKGARYDATSIEGQRCFLSSLNQPIRDVLREYESSCQVINERKHDADYAYFLQILFERMPDFDIQLIVENQTFLAHRAILAARSTYFLNVLKSAAITDGTLELDVSFNVPGIKAALQYIYTGKVDIERAEVPLVKKLFYYLNFEKMANLLDKASSGEGSVISIQRKEFLEDVKKDLLMLTFSAVPPQFYQQLPEGASQAVGDVLYSDVVFSVQGHSFQCHKVFFYGRSEYFRVLLIEKEEDMPPAFDGYRPTIKLEDMAADIFAQVVAYIYGDRCQITNENCTQLLVLAEKLALTSLKKELLVWTSQNVTPQTVSSGYETAKRLELPKLQDECVKYMAERIFEMCSVPEFKQLIRQEVRPNEHSELLDNLLYYIRKDKNTPDKQLVANRNLARLEKLLKTLGMNEDLPRVAIETGETITSGYPPVRNKPKSKNKNDDCGIL